MNKIYDYSLDKLLTTTQAAELLQAHIVTARADNQSREFKSLSHIKSPGVLAVKAIDGEGTVNGRKRIGETLLELGYLTETQLGRALEYQRDKGGRLGLIVITLGFVTESELYEGLAKHLWLPFVSDTLYIRESIDRHLAAMITHKEMADYQAVPFSLRDGILYVLTADPENQDALDFLKRRFVVNRIGQIVITGLDLTKISEGLYQDNISDMLIHEFFYRKPEKSTQKVLCEP